MSELTLLTLRFESESCKCCRLLLYSCANPFWLGIILWRTMLLTLQEFLSLFCAIILLLILYVLVKIRKAVRQREPVAIEHDPALVRESEVIRNRQRGWQQESENHSVRMRRSCAIEHDESQGWNSFNLFNLFLTGEETLVLTTTLFHFLLLSKFFRLHNIIDNPQETDSVVMLDMHAFKFTWLRFFPVQTKKLRSSISSCVAPQGDVFKIG